MKITKEERKVLIIWFIIGIVIISLLYIIKVDRKIKEEKKYDQPYTLVRDHSRFYTVNSAINKYYSYLNNKNYKSVMNILSSSFLEEKNITSKNIKESISIYDKLITYDADYMCYKEIKKGIYSFYVKGSLSELNSAKFIENQYYEVILDGNTFHYSLTPVDEQTFGGVCNE